MKTLMLIPVYNCGKTLPTLFSFLYKLKPQPDLYVFAENNSSDNTLERVWGFKRPHKVIRLWFRPDAVAVSQTKYDPIAHVRQLLLTTARQYDPDYALFLDSDVYPQTRELIEELTAWNKDIVGGAYLRVFPQGLYVASKWKAWGKPGQYIMQKKVNVPLDEPMMTSAGCLCLSRKIIQDRRVNFYPVQPAGSSEDFGYCLQARSFGYDVYLDGQVKLQHAIPKRIPLKPWTFDPIKKQPVPFLYNT
jgi:GT2 family glycosyltransferase